MYLEEIIKLNVGGKIFHTTYATLAWVKDSYFQTLLSDDFKKSLDSDGNIFIDRDPELFSHILHFLRTKELSIDSLNVSLTLIEEAEYFGVLPMVLKLRSYLSLTKKHCGNIYFSGFMSMKDKFFYASDVLKHDNQNSDPIYDLDLPMVKDEYAIVLIAAHNNYIAAATKKFISIFSAKHHSDWSFMYNTIPLEDDEILKLAINVKILQVYRRLLAFTTRTNLFIYDISYDENCRIVSNIDIPYSIDYLYFNSFHLLTLCKRGLISCWSAISNKWLKQETETLTCCDMFQSLLILATKTSKIKGVDLVKFPLRMTDYDMLISEIYNAPNDDEITAISLYTRIPFQTKEMTYWLELSYGTKSGSVYVLGHHPETAGTQLRIFYTLRVHTTPISKIVLGEKYLFTICENEFHVRTYRLSRFRDMLNTQPGLTIVSSFNIMDYSSYFGPFLGAGRSKGPYMSGDGECFFVEQLQPYDLQIKVRSGVTGDLLCTINSADASEITSYNINFCDNQNASSACAPTLYFFTGHQSGTVQVWNLSIMIDEKNPLRIKEEETTLPKKNDIMKFLQSYKYEH